MSATRLLNILQSPLVTEKTSQVSGEYKHYAFKVLPDANKFEIRAAVEQLLNVKVRSVQTCQVKCKSKRRKLPGQKLKTWKKAYVILEKDQEIDITKQ